MKTPRNLNRFSRFGLNLQLLSRSSRVSFGGPGKFNITNWASCDLFTMTSFNLTAVCMRRTLSSSLVRKQEEEQEEKKNTVNFHAKKRPDSLEWTYGLMLGFEFSFLSDFSSEYLFVSELSFVSLSFSLSLYFGNGSLFGDEWLLKLLSPSRSQTLSSSSFSVSFSVRHFSLLSILLESLSWNDGNAVIHSVSRANQKFWELGRGQALGPARWSIHSLCLP